MYLCRLLPVLLLAGALCGCRRGAEGGAASTEPGPGYLLDGRASLILHRVLTAEAISVAETRPVAVSERGRARPASAAARLGWEEVVGTSLPLSEGALRQVRSVMGDHASRRPRATRVPGTRHWRTLLVRTGEHALRGRVWLDPGCVVWDGGGVGPKLTLALAPEVVERLQALLGAPGAEKK